MGKYELQLDHDRLAEARVRLSAWYAGEPVDQLPFVYGVPAPEGKLPGYNSREVVLEPDKAVEQQIANMNWQTESFPDSDWLPMFQNTHLGQGLIPSMFGAKQLIVEHNSPFTEGRLLSTIDEVAALPEHIDPEHDGWGPKLKEVCEKFLDAADGVVPICVADHQSPYGIATKLIGNEALMLAMYDAPELVDRLLTICTDATIDVIRAMERWVGPENLARNARLPIPGQGGVVIWDDYISVISPSLHQRFCRPHNVRLFETFGSGHLHTCGPYFEGYVDAATACEPVSIDLSAMRGMTRPREDLLALRRIATDRGIKLAGSLTAHPGHQLEGGQVVPPDEEFVQTMAQGGLLWCESGDAEVGQKYRGWARQ